MWCMCLSNQPTSQPASQPANHWVEVPSSLLATARRLELFLFRHETTPLSSGLYRTARVTETTERCYNAATLYDTTRWRSGRDSRT